MADLDLPYNPISRFYRERFNAKVYKISVAVADTCPNREGLRGMQTCNFCDQWGSAAYAENLKRPLLEQIESVRQVLREKRGAEKFLVYFQAYTTTFSKARELREQLFAALDCEGVVGLVVGTRPDCLSEGFLETCNELCAKTFLALELGVQSFDNRALEWMRRGHTAEQSIAAMQKIREKCPEANLSCHLIFGAPGETDAMAIESAKILNSHEVDAVKLHHLHVLKGTALAEQYARGEFEPLDREAYFQRCCIFLQHLDKDIHVHRLSAFSPRWDELVAPAWTSYKMKTYQDMLDYMKARGAYQGQNA
jgi:radical SAM protein (TIGR01212 family)